MGTLTRSIALLAAGAFLTPIGASGQAQVSLAFETGSLFTGVGISTASYYDGGSVFVNASLGTYYGTRYRPRHGFYSSSYHYTPVVRTYVSSSSCWDSYWDSYWDPYGGWYVDCVVHGPYAYNSYRARSWRWRWGIWGSYTIYRSPRYAYVHRPYIDPWAPYWVSDPWNSYWTGYRDGYVDGRWSRWYAPRSVRRIYAYGGRTGVATYRPSPLSRSTRYKEDPGYRASTRTAVRRTANTTASPTTTRIAQDRTATPASRPSGRIAPASRASDVRRGGATAPSSSGARVAPTRGRTGSTARPSGRIITPGERERSSDRVAPNGGTGSVAPRATPSTRSSDRPSSRLAPTRTPTQPRAGAAASGRDRPSSRLGPQNAPDTRRPSMTPRSDGRATPSTAPRASRGTPTVRPEPRSTPRVRSTPSQRSGAGARPTPSSQPERAAPSRAPVRTEGARPSVTRRAPGARSSGGARPTRAEPSTRSAPRSRAPSARPAPSSRGPSARPAPSSGSRGSAPSSRRPNRRPGGSGGG